MADIGSLVVKIAADASELQRELGKVGTATKKMSDGFELTAKNAKWMATTALAAGTAISGAFLAITASTAATGDTFAKMSQKIGVSVEDLSAMAHVANLAGTSIEGMQISLGRLARNMNDAAQGTGEAKKAFEALDIQSKDADGSLRPVKDILLEVSDKFSKMEDGTKKTALAMELFGRSGMDMIPMLNEGREAMAAGIEEAKALGVVWTRDAAKSAEEFNDNLERLQAGIGGITQEISKAFIPIMAEMVKGLQPVIESAVQFAKWFDGLDAGVKKTVAIFVGAFAVGGPLVVVVGAAIAAITAISAPILLGGAVILGIVAGVAAIIANWEKIKEKANAIWQSLVTTITGWVKKLVDEIHAQTIGRLNAVWDTVNKKVESVKNTFKDLYESVVGKSYVPDMVEEIGDHMRMLDAEMVAPARNAAVNTERAFEGLGERVETVQDQMVRTFAYSWGAASSTVSNALARMTTEHQNWAEIGIGIGQQFLANFINLGIQMSSQWLVMQTATATATGGIWASAGAFVVGVWGTVTAAMTAMFSALVGIVTAVGTAIMGVLSAIAAALTKTVFGIPYAGAILVGVALIAASLVALKAVKFAEGGIVTGPTFGMLGEAGPEAVIPLDRMGSFGGESQRPIQVTLNIDGKRAAKALVRHTASAWRAEGAGA